MKKLFSSLFAVVGTLLMVGTALLCLLSLNAQPHVLVFPQEASLQAQAFAEAVTRGDLESAGQYLYGQPELTADADWDDPAKSRIWDAYLESLSCVPVQDPKAENDGIQWQVRIKMLDISALMESWQQQTSAILASEQDGEEDETLDEQAQEEIISAALTQGLEKALAGERKTLSQEVTLNLIYREGQWWVSPDAALLQLLSGRV